MKLPAFHLKRYRQIAWLLWKYGRSDIAQQMSAEEGFGVDELLSAEGQPLADNAPPSAGQASPEHLADDLEAMGPTYVKLGQVLAGRPDLLPDAYLKALARLQDNVKPFPYVEVEEAVMAELGVRISKAFSRFDVEPVAAASLGQVHRGALRDGRAVVVKGTEKLDDLMRSLLHASSRILERALKTLPHVTRERLAGDLASVLQCLEQEERAE